MSAGLLALWALCSSSIGIGAAAAGGAGAGVADRCSGFSFYNDTNIYAHDLPPAAGGQPAAASAAECCGKCLDFGTLSQQLMSSINQNDMQEFAGSLQGQGGVGDIGSMFTMLAGMMQGISGGGAAGTTGAPDAQAMLASAAQALGGEPNSSGDQ